MTFLCTSRFDVEEQEVKLSGSSSLTYRENMEAANKDKDKKLDGVLIAPISDTEEQDTIIHDEIGQDEADEEVCEAQLPLSRNNIQVETMIALSLVTTRSQIQSIVLLTLSASLSYRNLLVLSLNLLLHPD